MDEITYSTSKVETELDASDITPFLPTHEPTDEVPIAGDTYIKPQARSLTNYISGTHFNIYVWATAILAIAGGILFGYDLGIISGALLQLRQEFCLGIVRSEASFSIISCT